MNSKRLACSFLLLLVSLSSTSLSAPIGDEETAKTERAKREGNWVMASWEADGKALPAEVARKWKMVMKGNEFILYYDGKEIERGTHRIDVTKKPYREDFTVTEGDGKGREYLGIYAVEGKRFTCCYADKAQGRPEVFRSGRGQTLVIWQREEK